LASALPPGKKPARLQEVLREQFLVVQPQRAKLLDGLQKQTGQMRISPPPQFPAWLSVPWKLPQPANPWLSHHGEP
jgi:hypothetical protein